MNLDNYKFIKKINTNDFYLLQFDGASKGNGGESGGGSVLYKILLESKKKIFKYGEYLNNATNNQAEYNGLIGGLKKAISLNIKNILIEGDSKLVIFQLLNLWKVKNEILKELYNKVKELFNEFDSIGLRHIYREYNKKADSIANDTVILKNNIYKIYKKNI